MTCGENPEKQSKIFPLPIPIARSPLDTGALPILTSSKDALKTLDSTRLVGGGSTLAKCMVVISDRALGEDACKEFVKI